MLFEKVLKSRTASLRNSELPCPNEVVFIVVILKELAKGTTSSKVRASKAPFPRLEEGGGGLSSWAGLRTHSQRTSPLSLILGGEKQTNLTPASAHRSLDHNLCFLYPDLPIQLL